VTSRHRYLLVLSLLFLIVWIALAIKPPNRADWALENGLLLAFVALLALTYKRLPLSRISYTLNIRFSVSPRDWCALHV
jgi:putative membrane protein